MASLVAVLKLILMNVETIINFYACSDYKKNYFEDRQKTIVKAKGIYRVR